MNARWFRDNLMMVIFAIVFVGVLSGLIYFVIDAQAHQVTVQQELDTQNDELQQLLHAKEFPSTENINVLTQDNGVVSNLYARMLTAAARPPVEAPKLLTRGIDFSQWMRSTVESLGQNASNNNVRIPENFAFGFTRYIGTFPCQNPAPSDEECRKILASLGKQLVLIEKLTHILLSSHIDEITAIRRVEVEPGGAGTDALNVPPANNSKSLYQTYPFEVDFISDTQGLRDFINNLAQADCLFVIRSIKIDTSLNHRTFITESKPKSDEAELVKVADQTSSVEFRRVVITMRLDLIEFAQPKQPAPAVHHGKG